MTAAQSDFVPSHTSEQQPNNLYRWFTLVGLVYLMLLAVSMIGGGFKSVTGGHAEELFQFASNPFMGLVIGMMATALLQSSSTVTSIIVAMVAGGLPITIAVPMMMGANIGTSITNTIVSLGHIAKKEEFKRAFHAATIHDFFNVLSVLIFLPLEIAFGILEHLTAWVVTHLAGAGTFSIGGINPIKAVTKPVTEVVSSGLSFLPSVYPGLVSIFIGIALIVVSITFMGKIMKSLMVGRAKDILYNSIGRGPISGISAGTFVTVLVQSSSTTTSLMVPLVGTGVLKAREIYPFTLGANIGTCITALIAAFGISGEMSGVALQIALVHLFYNLIGVSVIYGIPFTRELPPRLSGMLASRVAEHKVLGLVYIAGLFFVIPGLFLFFS